VGGRHHLRWATGPSRLRAQEGAASREGRSGGLTLPFDFRRHGGAQCGEVRRAPTGVAGCIIVETVRARGARG
jgi:hypothetical protein